MGESRPVTALTSGSSRPSRPATAEAGGYVGEHNLLQDEDHLIECDNILVRCNAALACFTLPPPTYGTCVQQF